MSRHARSPQRGDYQEHHVQHGYHQQRRQHEQREPRGQRGQRGRRARSGVSGSRRAKSPRGPLRTVLAVAATAAAAGVGVILSGAVPMPPGFSPGLAVAGDPAGAVSVATARPSGATSPRPRPIGARPTSVRNSPGAPPAVAPSGSSSASAGPSATASASGMPSVSASGTATALPSQSASVSVSATASTATDQVAVLDLVNAARAQAGCGALTASPALTTLAQSFSQEMATRGFFSHTDPDGLTPWDRADALGITNLGGENIARGQQTPDAVMSAWLASPGHRANILDCSYHSLGVGVYYGEGGPWWTQDFGF